MVQFVEDSALASRPDGAPLRITFFVIMAAGIASWALVLSGLYFAWTVVRSLFS